MKGMASQNESINQQSDDQIYTFATNTSQHDTLSDDSKMNEPHYSCICGHNLIKIEDASTLYEGNGWMCDICERTTKIAWHCDQDFHPFGFDICNNCIQVIDIPSLTARYCYCGAPLDRVRMSGEKGFVCRNCCREWTTDDKLTYKCLNENCFYEAISALQYDICSNCYQQPVESTVDTDHDIQNAWIYRKFQSSMKAIS